MHRLLAIVAVFLVASCARYSLVDAETTSVRGAFTVAPQIAWSRWFDGKVELWTVDGPPLNAVFFVPGLDNGEGLFSAADEEQVRLNAKATAGEIVEFVVDSMLGAGWSAVEADTVTPANLGTHPGFRFEIRCTSAQGLPQRGLGVAALVDQKLYLVLYIAAEDHYFDLYRPHVVRMIDSIAL